MPSDLPIDLDGILARGGEQRIALLRFCVMSVNLEPVFVFLAGEYRLRPSHAGALALYDVFCAPRAPAAIRAQQVLPPRNLRLSSAARVIRDQYGRLQSGEAVQDTAEGPVTTPYKNLFDFVVDAVQHDPQGRFLWVSRQFDPALSAQQNLAGERMTPVQRHFVENIWRRIVRPRLVAAGFWQIATIE